MYSLARYIRRNIRAANAKVKMTISTADPPWSVWWSLGGRPWVTAGEADDLLWPCCRTRRCRGLMEVSSATGWAGCWRDAAKVFWTPHYEILTHFVWNWQRTLVYVHTGSSTARGISERWIWLRAKLPRILWMLRLVLHPPE